MLLVDSVFNAIRNAEAKKKSPVYLIEIYKAFKSEDSTDLSLSAFKDIVFDLFRNDQVLANQEMTKFSLQIQNQNQIQSPTEYNLCSDWFISRYPSCVFDSKCKVKPG